MSVAAGSGLAMQIAIVVVVVLAALAVFFAVRSVLERRES